METSLFFLQVKGNNYFKTWPKNMAKKVEHAALFFDFLAPEESCVKVIRKKWQRHVLICV